MIKKEFKGLKISALGLGCMRFPVLDNEEKTIDKKAVKEMFDYAINNGINYFDTAWGYHNGESEPVVGEILKSYPRDKFFLASKFPGFNLENMGKVKEIFEKQLKRCQVEYFDFYLFHNVCEANIEEYLDRSYGVFEYLVKQKKEGRIKHLGFSVHGNCDTIERFLEAYGSEIEFCQIQLNWLDYKMQSAKEKVELLKKWGLPVWVMEPVRGGRLASLDKEYEAELNKLRPKVSAPEWAFRFIQTIPEVVVTLSGMSDMTQLKENIETFKEEKPLNEKEMQELLSVADNMMEKKILPCTSCRYCEERCPKGLDISGYIGIYNEFLALGNFVPPSIILSMPEDKRPHNCIGCGVCEKACPQSIKITEVMERFTKLFKK